jgi:histidinol-phosphatase (PHP family)
MKPFNYHCHATYSDGKNTPEEMVLVAIEAGSDSFGISEHYVSAVAAEYSVKLQKESLYRAEMGELKEKYKDKIELFLGAEVDFTSPPASGYDYIIGSVHFFEIEGQFIGIDLTAQGQIDAANKYFGGDMIALACNYYEILEKMPQKFKFDIVGHFDLVTKFNEGDKLFDTSNKRYVSAAERALEALMPTGAVFEINTGAIARGHRNDPYPSNEMIEYIGARGGSFILSSDAHKKEHIAFEFDKWQNEYKNLNFVEI